MMKCMMLMMMIGLLLASGATASGAFQPVGFVRGDNGQLYEAYLVPRTEREVLREAEGMADLEELIEPVGGAQFVSHLGSYPIPMSPRPHTSRVSGLEDLRSPYQPTRVQRSGYKTAHRADKKKQDEKEYDAWIMSNLG